MVLVRCQYEPYLRSLTSEVVSCKEEGKLYAVELKDTILFPEGGGQPADCGTVGAVRVVDVQRVEDKVVHYTDAPLLPGDSVEVVLDWDRRFDHMQQHSGQHIISALAHTHFGLITTSWKMGKSPQSSYVELDGIISADIVNELEKKVNVVIQNHKSVRMHVLNNAQSVSFEANSKKLSDKIAAHDFEKTALRVIEIDGLDDFNACCGTHVENTAHLQMVKFLGVEKGKGNTSRLNFVVGGRCIHMMQQIVVDLCGQLTGVLSTGPDQFVTTVERIKQENKSSRKEVSQLLVELAEYEAASLVEKIETNEEGKDSVILFKRFDFDLSLLRVVSRKVEELFPNVVLICLGNGQFSITGPDDRVSRVGKSVCGVLSAKGGGGKGRPFQGKFDLSLAKDDKVMESLRTIQ